MPRTSCRNVEELRRKFQVAPCRIDVYKGIWNVDKHKFELRYLKFLKFLYFTLLQ
jgi:hypothetical protein